MKTEWARATGVWVSDTVLPRQSRSSFCLRGDCSISHLARSLAALKLSNSGFIAVAAMRSDKLTVCPIAGDIQARQRNETRSFRAMAVPGTPLLVLSNYFFMIFLAGDGDSPDAMLQTFYFLCIRNY